jgi:hypothetical protein
VLTRFTGPIVAAFLMAACASAPPSPASDPPTQPTIAARWVAVDGSVVALNVVLARTSDPRRLPELARRYRREYPGARVIVTFFAASAGEERFVIGYVPTDGGPLPAGSRPASLVALYDFPA